jgi:putative membrane protein
MHDDTPTGERGDAAAEGASGAGSGTEGARSPGLASGEVHRTRLAHERTYLAWWRTGLAGIAAGFAIGRVLPDAVGGANWPYVAFGTVLAASGLAAMAYGIVHYRELQAALREGREPNTSEGFVLALAALGIALGIASVLLVLLAP